MNWDALGVILVSVGLIANVAVVIFGKPKSTGDLHKAVELLNVSIVKLNAALESALNALKTLEAEFKIQWKRIDLHTAKLGELNTEMELIKARCKWVQDHKEARAGEDE